MKTKDDHFTSEMFGNRPGSPRKVNAMTGAHRVAKHRASKKAISVTCNEKSRCTLCASASACSGVCAVGQLG